MKIKHNKKRNTALVFELLVREMAVSVLKNEPKRKNAAYTIIKEFFKPNSVLKKELDCYKSLYNNQNLNDNLSQKILWETKIQKKSIDSKKLFLEQTRLIDSINKQLSPDVFSNFVPNYKTLASIAQIFSDNTSPKNRVLLENKILADMCLPSTVSDPNEQIDPVVYRLFTDKFNKKYNERLIEEQKQLLNLYVHSFADNALELKMFINEEIPRLKEMLQKAKNTDEIQSDADMLEKTNSVIEKLNSYFNKPVNEELLLTILKTQELVKEIYTDGD